jgi:hypothetical protein
MTDYTQQYLKYKFKYLSAQSNLKGGSIELGGITGLSIAALIAGIIYYIYTKKFTNAKTCLNELEKKDSENIDNHKTRIKLVIKEVSNNDISNIKSNQVSDEGARMMTDKERKEFETMHEVYESLLNIKNNKPDKKKTPE